MHCDETVSGLETFPDCEHVEVSVKESDINHWIHKGVTAGQCNGNAWMKIRSRVERLV
jgi:hypothetical protein